MTSESRRASQHIKESRAVPEAAGGSPGLGMGTISGTDVTLGARLLAEPLRIRPGFIRARFHTTGQGLGEHERGGRIEFAAELIGGAGGLESQGPPVLAARVDLGEFHLAPRLLA